MNTFLKRLLVILILVAVGLFLYSYFIEDVFSKSSPKAIAKFEQNDTKLEVQYSRPSKKGRAIFGALVPYNMVWRTGANEATTFTTNKNLIVDGVSVPKGEYTLWTIPNDTLWKVYFNTHQYKWGVDEQMRPMREPKYDLVEIDVPVLHTDHTIEQFTIGFTNITDSLKMTMSWDETKIEIPLEISKEQPQ